MLIYDRRLTDPSPRELRTAFANAHKLATQHRRPGQEQPVLQEWFDAFDVCVEPEGVLTSPNVGERERLGGLAVAWWTDSHGQRTWRIVARPVRGIIPAWPVDRPALWWVFPERLYFRHREGQPSELVACCVCGVSGDPATLGWTGPRCGPCDDHRQERLASRMPLPVEPAGMIATDLVSQLSPSLTGDQLRASPDGRWLAGVDADRRLIVWDAETGRRMWRDEVAFRPVWLLPWDFTSDGRFLVQCRDANRVIVRSVGDWETEWTSFAIPDVRTLVGLADGRVAIVSGNVLRYAEPGTGEGPEVTLAPFNASNLHRCADGVVCGLLNRTDSATVRYDGSLNEVWRHPGLYGSLVVDPGGRSLASCDRSVTIRSPNGDRVFGTTANDLGIGVFTADDHFISGGEDGCVRLWRLADGQQLAAWEWHAGPITAMALSPDGRTLFTGSTDGFIKRWPWADLLERA